MRMVNFGGCLEKFVMNYAHTRKLCLCCKNKKKGEHYTRMDSHPDRQRALLSRVQVPTPPSRFKSQTLSRLEHQIPESLHWHKSGKLISAGFRRKKLFYCSNLFADDQVNEPAGFFSWKSVQPQPAQKPHTTPALTQPPNQSTFHHQQQKPYIFLSSTISDV